MKALRWHGPRDLRLVDLVESTLQPGEVLVTQAVADASQEDGIALDDIGPVELKGVSGTVHLLRAHFFT